MAAIGADGGTSWTADVAEIGADVGRNVLTGLMTWEVDIGALGLVNLYRIQWL